MRMSIGKPEALYRGRDLGAQLDRIQGELADLGLIKTMQAVNKAVQSLGWELADALEKRDAR